MIVYAALCILDTVSGRLQLKTSPHWSDAVLMYVSIESANSTGELALVPSVHGPI